MIAPDAGTDVNSPAIMGNTPLDSSLDHRHFGTSFFSVPHRVAITASVGLPFRSRFSLIYQGSSQGPYTYVVQPGGNNGDVNADGTNIGGSEFGAGNEDILYVPRDVRPGGDIRLVTWNEAAQVRAAPASEYAELDKFISNEQCLDRQRGRIMARNSCRNAWYGHLMPDSRWTCQPFEGGGLIQLTADVTNLPALLHLPDFDPIWTTTYRATDSGEPSVPLLELQGYDTVKQRGIYSLAPIGRNSEDQVWSMQIGVRYSF
jgi:hypothetical protein